MTKRICNGISTLLLVVLLAVAAVLLLPLLLGYKEMAVLSGSMEPGIPVGSIVYVKPMEAQALQPGDVCTYRLPDGVTYVTHRVVSTDPAAKTLVTQGDANDAPDGAIAFSQVLGRSDFHLPLLGYITMTLRTPTGILVGCGLLVVILLVNFIPMILAAGEEEKKAKSKAE